MKRLLIANRGEIARRIIRTAQRMGIETVAVYADSDATALHVQEATLAYALQGTISANTYLSIPKLLAAAKATGADAVHPGYGFLSENPDFAQAVQDAGLTWVGPSPASIRLLGSKASAKRLALAAGVPCLPGFDGLDEHGQASATVQSDERFMQEAQRIGFPLMVKAINGGGGRGMRRVDQQGDLPAALASARQEALGAFGDASVLLERALINPRHIEVQVFGDMQGQVVHLGERDCSVQRRNQKIIEESPSPALNDVQRQAICAAAVALAKAAHYVGAGTVEFLLTDTAVPTAGANQAVAGPPQDGGGPHGGQGGHVVPTVGANTYFLMEMNTRLQVEHPVTEMRYGLDLVEWQIRVARGEALPLAQEDLHPTGHAIELRLCAEDEHFVPHSGTIAYAQVPAEQAHLRCDHALHSRAQVSPHFDPMVGKLIAWGPDRSQALARVLHGLQSTQVLGLPSNLALLTQILRHPAFTQGHAHIAWLTQEQAHLAQAVAAAEVPLVPWAALAYFALCAPTDPRPTAFADLACPFPVPLLLEHRGERISMRLQCDPQGQFHLSGPQGLVASGSFGSISPLCEGGIRLCITLNGVTQTVSVVATSATQRHIQVGGLGALWVHDLSHSASTTASNGGQAGALRSPMNGKVLAVLVEPGQQVSKGDTLVVLESMKLEHRLLAASHGVVGRVAAQVGNQAQTGQVLVEWETTP